MDRTKLDKYPKVRYFVGTQKKSINFYDNKIVMFWYFYDAKPP